MEVCLPLPGELARTEAQSDADFKLHWCVSVRRCCTSAAAALPGRRPNAAKRAGLGRSAGAKAWKRTPAECK